MIRTIIFDWKRTLYDPDKKSLMSGAVNILSILQKKNISLILIGKGGKDMYDEVERLDVKKFFSMIVFKEGPKDLSIYKPYITKNPRETVFVGDRIRSELAAGNKLRAVTIWLKQGKFAEEGPLDESQKSTFIVTTIEELEKLLLLKIN